MIRTVFATSTDPRQQWQAELLEHSFRQARQPGELVRLVAATSKAPLPSQHTARVFRALPWNPHPWVRGSYPAYITAAAVFEWLYHHRIDGTILLLEPNSVFYRAVTEEVEPGRAIAAPWAGLPTASNGPFALPESYEYLRQVCVRSDLELARVTLPVLIHSRDLLRMAPRWLELMMIIRRECDQAQGPSVIADRLAYAIAAAEYRIHHEPGLLGIDTDSDVEDASIHCYRRAVESPRGEIVWDPQTYQPWQRIAPTTARPGPGRHLLELLEQKIDFHESGSELTVESPLLRCDGVREVRNLDQLSLEIPGQEDRLSLSPSAAAIWGLCNDQRTSADIADELATSFEIDLEQMRADVAAGVEQLQDAGALRLAQAPLS